MTRVLLVAAVVAALLALCAWKAWAGVNPKDYGAWIAASLACGWAASLVRT